MEAATRSAAASGVSPSVRGRMNDVKSYSPPFALGKVMDGGADDDGVARRGGRRVLGISQGCGKQQDEKREGEDQAHKAVPVNDRL